MNKHKLREFATFALEQDMRYTQGKDFISKFGVGAKQAGFYLGDRITIITRKRNEPLLEFVIDEARLKQRAEEKANVFRDSIVVRDGSLDVSTIDTSKSMMMQYIQEHQSSNSHFTVIILRMRPHISRQMMSHPVEISLSKELADIYHFHLHPNDLPDNAVREERFKTIYQKAIKGHRKDRDRGQSGGLETLPLRSNFRHVASENVASPLCISVEVVRKGPSPGLSLSQVALSNLGLSSRNRIIRPLKDEKRSAPWRLFHADGCYPFRFNLVIPDPRSDDLTRPESKEVDKLLKDPVRVSLLLSYVFQ